jgi:membrane AbrB-like protein
MPTREAAIVTLRTLAIAAVGGFISYLLGMPAGWLSGAMVAVSACAIGGMQSRVPPRLVDAVFIVVGALLGGGITPEIVARAGSWPLSLAALMLSVVAMAVGVQLYLTRIAGWDRTTAFFTSIPGAFSYVVLIAAESGADLRRVVVGQSVRVFLLVAGIPALVSIVEPIPQPDIQHVIAPLPLVLLLVASTLGALALHRLRVPGGYLSGALLVSGLAYANGFVSGAFPPWLTVSAYVILGALIGSRFSGTSLAFLRSIAGAALGAFGVAIVITGVFAVATAAIVDVPIGQVLVAFAPGGLDAMAALALTMHMDSAFVAVHQLARFIAIAIVAPFAARWFLREG